MRRPINMYILFEMARADDYSFENWDAMGWTDDEIKAKEWVDLNPKYRQYKYCTDMKY